MMRDPEEEAWMNAPMGIPPFTAAGWLDRAGHRLPWSHPFSGTTNPGTSRADVVMRAWDDLTTRGQRQVVDWLANA